SFQIVTTVLLGLLLTPALAQQFQNTQGNQQFGIEGGYQFLNMNWEWREATVEEKSTRGSWKTVWNYDTGFIATRVLPERACFISTMNRNEMPRFDALPRLVEERRRLNGQGRPAREITFDLVRRPVRNLKSYGAEIFNMCRGLATYMAYQVRGAQSIINQESCIRLDVLQVLGLNYCR
ncbi:Gastrokine-1, partial [Cariama cristata]